MNAASQSHLIACPACGATNRVSQERLGQGMAPVCGRCKTPLPQSAKTAKPLIVGDGNFADLVESSPLPVLVDFWAAWCGPCRMIAPVVDELAREFAERARIAKLNVDDNPLVASRFGVRSIPTLIIFQNGREVDRIVGAAQKAQLVQRLTRYL